MSDPTAKLLPDAPSPLATSAAKHYAKELLRYLSRRLGGVQDAEDCAQEVYLRLLRIDRDMLIRKPIAFVIGVAARVLADHRSDLAAGRSRFVSAEDVPDAYFEYPSEDLADRVEENVGVQQQLVKALSTIPPMHAAVLILHKRDGMSYEEVAAELNLSVNTVHKYLTEGRAQLRMQRWAD